MTIFRDDAVVLRTYKLGEADKIVVMMTKGRGKVRAVAKGVRKTKSKFGARLEPASHVAAQFYEGRDLDIVTQVESHESFRSFWNDFSRLGHAQVLLEATDQFAQEGERNTGLYTMLVRALRTLDTTGSPWVVTGFLLKLLQIEGVGLMVTSCVICGGAGPLVAISFEHGGAVCASCGVGSQLSPEVLEVLNEISTGGLHRVMAAGNNELAVQVEHVATDAVEAHLDRRLRSLRVGGM